MIDQAFIHGPVNDWPIAPVHASPSGFLVYNTELVNELVWLGDLASR